MRFAGQHEGEELVQPAITQRNRLSALEDVKGRAFVIYWSASPADGKVRRDRIGQRIE